MKIIKHFSDIISGSDNIYINLLFASPGVSWIQMVFSTPLYRSPNYQKRPFLDVPRECFFLCLLDIGIGISVADLLQKISIPTSQRTWIFVEIVIWIFSRLENISIFFFFFIKNGTHNFTCCDFNHYFSWLPCFSPLISNKKEISHNFHEFQIVSFSFSHFIMRVVQYFDKFMCGIVLYYIHLTIH